MGIWLRLKDDYPDNRIKDANALDVVWSRNWDKVFALRHLRHLEAGHEGPIDIENIDQVVAIPRDRFCEFEVWCETPSPALHRRIETYADRYGYDA